MYIYKYLCINEVADYPFIWPQHKYMLTFGRDSICVEKKREEIANIYTIDVLEISLCVAYIGNCRTLHVLYIYYVH